MKFSVFTISHNLSKIDKPLYSLAKQDNKDFEWIILLNGEAEKELDSLYEKIKKLSIDVKIFKDGTQNQNIGYLKKKCCSFTEGEILVELDHDDELTPDCLNELEKAFKKDYDFCYSSDYIIETKNDKEEYITPFPTNSGWKVNQDENGNVYHPSFPPCPLAFSYIWYAPDHVRAWRKAFYNKINGHDETLDVCDDYELLCRTYINGKCFLIEKPLYKYYFHAENTSRNEKNQRIQELTREIHDRYILDIVSKWSDENGLKKVDLCSCNNKPKGFIGIDKRKLNDEDIVFDLDKPDWPFKTGSVGVFRIQDAIEHLKDPINTMKEIHRCLSDYGWAIIDVPSTDGRGAFQDPTHVSFWNSNSFWYYSQAPKARFIGTPVKFQVNRVTNYYPSKFEEFHNIVYTRAHLVKLPKVGFEIPIHGREI